MSDLRDQIAATLKAEGPRIVRSGGDFNHVIADTAMTVVQPKLDAQAAEIENQRAELERTRHILEIVADADLRHQHQLNLAVERAVHAEALLPQLEAAENALDQIKHLAINARLAEGLTGWNLNPADILTALDQAQETT